MCGSSCSILISFLFLPLCVCVCHGQIINTRKTYPRHACIQPHLPKSAWIQHRFSPCNLPSGIHKATHFSFFLRLTFTLGVSSLFSHLSPWLFLHVWCVTSFFLLSPHILKLGVCFYNYVYPTRWKNCKRYCPF